MNGPRARSAPAEPLLVQSIQRRSRLTADQATSEVAQTDQIEAPSAARKNLSQRVQVFGQEHAEPIAAKPDGSLPNAAAWRASHIARLSPCRSLTTLSCDWTAMFEGGTNTARGASRRQMRRGFHQGASPLVTEIVAECGINCCFVWRSRVNGLTLGRRRLARRPCPHGRRRSFVQGHVIQGTAGQSRSRARVPELVKLGASVRAFPKKPGRARESLRLSL